MQTNYRYFASEQLPSTSDLLETVLLLLLSLVYIISLLPSLLIVPHVSMMTSPVVLEQGLKRPAFFLQSLRRIFDQVIITFINLADKGIRKKQVGRFILKHTEEKPLSRAFAGWVFELAELHVDIFNEPFRLPHRT